MQGIIEIGPSAVARSILFIVNCGELREKNNVGFMWRLSGNGAS
jgi:hypothetical protein